MPAYDPAARRRGVRRGRERGCWVYVPAEVLEELGVDPRGPAPLYRVWAGSRGGLFLRFYREARSVLGSRHA